MKRKVGILLCCAIIFFSLAGCQLARENVDAEMNAQLDRLTGVLVTREHLDWNLPDGKLYATPHTQTSTNDTGATIESMTYNFENVVGFAYFMPKIPATSEDNSYWATIGDEEISDGSTAINVGDDGTSLILEGTIYVLPTDVMFCYNPVYQSADGNVYAVAGQSYSVSGMSDGMTMSQTLDDTNTVTENGETKTDSTSVKITVKAMSTPEKLVVLQMDADSNILSRAQYAPGAAPDTLTPERGTAYLIVEVYSRDTEENSKVERAIYDGSAETFETLAARADGILVKHSTQIMWQDQG